MSLAKFSSFVPLVGEKNHDFGAEVYVRKNR